MNEVLQCQGLAKVFRQGSQSLAILQDIDFLVQQGERVAIIGQSGVGKSTLLHLLGGLDQPTAGTVIVAGQNLSSLSDTARARLRNRSLGFVYQFHHLLPEFSAVENVAMPLLIAKQAIVTASSRAVAMLTRVGLEHRIDHKPGELSGGERQRVAIARALVSEPACVLADEPTGNLDRRNADQVFALMLSLNEALGTSIVLVTHDQTLAAKMDTIWSLHDGSLHRER